MRVFVDKNDFMFSYGMNTNQVLMKLRCKEAVVIGMGELDYHRLHFRYHCDVAKTEAGHHKVLGIVWQLTDEDFERIDAAEGYPEYYTREKQYVTVYNTPNSRYNSLFNCWVYKMVEPSGFEPPDEAYLKLVMEGYDQSNIPNKQLIEALEHSNMMRGLND